MTKETTCRVKFPVVLDGAFFEQAKRAMKTGAVKYRLIVLLANSVPFQITHPRVHL